MPTLPTHGAHCIYRPALARLLSSCGALRWSWSCPAQVVHPGWCRHCTASRWSLHWSRHSSATHNTLPSHIIHPYRRKHCTADMHKIAVGAVHLGVILFSTSDSHSTHTHYCGHPGIGTAGPWTVDGGWWTPFGTGNTPSRDNLPTCQLNTHTTFQTLSDY